MSKKSPPPDGGKKKKGKKGKKGADSVELEPGQILVVHQEGVPFLIVVLVAAVLSAPTLLQYVVGSMAFEGVMVRVFAALAVSWLLTHLVYGVVEAIRPKDGPIAVTLSEPDHAHPTYEPPPAPAALSGSVVDETPYVPDLDLDLNLPPTPPAVLAAE